MVRAPRKPKAPADLPAELVEVIAVPYNDDDDDWDGVPVSNAVLTEEETATEPKKGRPGSPLLQATRDYEKAHKAAEKSRKAAEKYRPQIDALEANEAAEAEALRRLTTLLNRASDAEGDGDE